MKKNGLKLTKMQLQSNKIEDDDLSELKAGYTYSEGNCACSCSCFIGIGSDNNGSNNWSPGMATAYKCIDPED